MPLGRVGQVAGAPGQDSLRKAPRSGYTSTAPAAPSTGSSSSGSSHRPGELTEKEISSQPRVWTDVLAAATGFLPAVRELLQTRSPAGIVLTGCGSSFHVAGAAAYLFQTHLRIPCRAFPASELVLFPESVPTRPQALLLIAISRSAETTETIWALTRLQEQGVTTLALTCGEGTLTRSSHLSLVLPVEERSVVMTGSFTSMLLTLAFLAARLGSDDAAAGQVVRLPERAQQLLPSLSERSRLLIPNIDRFVYLGSGPLYSAALEGALKMTEMALIPSHAYQTLEFLHGPRAAVSPSMLVTGLLSGRAAEYERFVLKHVAGLGARVVAVGGTVDGLETVTFDFPPGSVPSLLLASVWMQLLALSMAQARGVDPDSPRFLERVVTWDEPQRRGGQ